jgi:SAM-dependent methyltransferase
MRYQLSRFGIDIYACEPDQEARDAARARGYVNVFPSEEDAFRRTWDMIGLFDVVEHIADDRAFFARAYDALSAHGRLAVTVPAFPFLWSSHDVSHHHFRRYTKAVMRQRLEAAGFQIEYESYWNMLLFFPAALMRLLGRSGESTLSLPRWLDGFFFAIVAMETKWMRLGSLPFGTGLVVIARKRSYSANDVV